MKLYWHELENMWSLMVLNPEASASARQPYISASLDLGHEAAGTSSQPRERVC